MNNDITEYGMMNYMVIDMVVVIMVVKCAVRVIQNVVTLRY